jgi:hypothetical protein
MGRNRVAVLGKSNCSLQFKAVALYSSIFVSIVLEGSLLRQDPELKQYLDSSAVRAPTYICQFYFDTKLLF